MMNSIIELARTYGTGVSVGIPLGTAAAYLLFKVVRAMRPGPVVELRVHHWTRKEDDGSYHNTLSNQSYHLYSSHGDAMSLVKQAREYDGKEYPDNPCDSYDCKHEIHAWNRHFWWYLGWSADQVFVLRQSPLRPKVE